MKVLKLELYEEYFYRSLARLHCSFHNFYHSNYGEKDFKFLAAHLLSIFYFIHHILDIRNRYTYKMCKNCHRLIIGVDSGIRLHKPKPEPKKINFFSKIKNYFSKIKAPAEA